MGEKDTKIEKIYVPYNDFLKDKNKKDVALYRTIIYLINKSNKNIKQWDEKDLENLLINLDSPSVTSLYKYYLYFKNLYKHYTSKNIEVPKAMAEYINYEKLREEIITYNDYKNILNDLEPMYLGEIVNKRDKVLFELAWLGLTSKEIQFLKEDDVEVINNNKVIIHLEDREMIVNDEELIKDLKDVKNERLYYRFDSEIRVLKYSYKDSPYLIKPISIRNDRATTNIYNLAIIFRQIAKRLSLDCNYVSKNHDNTVRKINIEALNLENIRRSKIIWYIGNTDYSLEEIKDIFGKKKIDDLRWLEKIAYEIYGGQRA